MVYKIIGEFNSPQVNFSKLLNNLSQYFSCLYTSDTLYVGLQKYAELERAEEVLKKTLKPSRLFYIEKISEKNLNKQAEIVQQWASDVFVSLDSQRYEIEKQEHLQRVWKAMDNLEAELEKKRIEENIAEENITEANTES